MKIRRIRIWLSRGWYRVVYSVSFLVLSFLCSCSSSRTTAKVKTGGSKGVEASKDKEPADSTKTGVSVINIEDFQGLGIETPEIRLMYGVPSPIQELKQAAPQDTAKSIVTVSGSKPQAGDMISGVVRDASGPIVMANITERDGSYRIVAHAVSDENGKFAFRLVNPADRLSVTFVGYGEAITDITGTSFEVTMVENTDIPVVDILNNARQTTMYGPPAVLFNTNSGQTMRLMYGVQPPVGGHPLVTYDDYPLEIDDSKLAVFDFEKDIYSRKKVAALLGVKRRQVKLSRMLKDEDAIKVWGTRGANGVLEIISRDNYKYGISSFPDFNIDDYQHLK